MSAPLRIAEVEKLSHDAKANVLAGRGTLLLAERGLTRWIGGCWDNRAFAAYRGDDCVGVLAFTEDDTDLSIRVTLAHVAAGAGSMVLAALCGALRARYRHTPFRTVEFTWHEGNPDMANAAARLGARVVRHTAEIDIGSAK